MCKVLYLTGLDIKLLKVQSSISLYNQALNDYQKYLHNIYIKDIIF